MQGPYICFGQGVKTNSAESFADKEQQKHYSILRPVTNSYVVCSFGRQAQSESLPNMLTRSTRTSPVAVGTVVSIGSFLCFFCLALCERRSQHFVGTRNFRKVRNNYEVGRIRRYNRNILQWNKNKTKNTNDPMETTPNYFKSGQMAAILSNTI